MPLAVVFIEYMWFRTLYDRIVKNEIKMKDDPYRAQEEVSEFICS